MKEVIWNEVSIKDVKKLPKQPGVYVVASNDYSDKFIAKFVGQTESLLLGASESKALLEENSKLNELVESSKIVKVFYTILDNKLDRDGIELYLYNEYLPCCNETKPQGNNMIICNNP